MTTIEIPPALFARLLAAHRRMGTGAWADEATGRQGDAHRELYAAMRDGHTRLSATAAFLAAQYPCRDIDDRSAESDFRAVCDLIPEPELNRIQDEYDAETARLRAEWRAEIVAKAHLSVPIGAGSRVVSPERSVDHA